MKRAFLDREAQRRDVELTARCRTFSGLRDKAQLTDISTHGCCVTCQGLLLNVGTRVVIQPAGLEGIAGMIRWISGSRAGVQFDAPLYAPIVEHLISLHPGRSSAQITLLQD